MEIGLGARSHFYTLSGSTGPVGLKEQTRNSGLISWVLLSDQIRISHEVGLFLTTSAVADLRAELKHITQRRKRKQLRCS